MVNTRKDFKLTPTDKDKRIEELEQSLRKLQKSTFHMIDEKNNHITDLEKENAELKEKLEIEKNARGDWFGKAVTKDRQLNEAKELIEDFMITETGGIGYSELYNKAEQFLKDNSTYERIQKAKYNYTN